MHLLGIDLGTTHSKVGLFEQNGKALAIVSRPTVTHEHADGFAYYDPEQMWEMVSSAIKEITNSVPTHRIAAIGITSMAESGLLVDRLTGEPRSYFMPWFDTCSTPQAEHIAAESEALERFKHSGLHLSFKLGLAKILWIRDRDPAALEGSVWLSASSYIAYRLTGKMAFDYSLAARTYAFSIATKKWDGAWLRHFGLDEALFPEAVPGGTVIGHVGEHGIDFGAIGLQDGIAVAIAGHDHVSSALAVGAITPEAVYDSMGTAETLVGTMSERELGEAEFAAGISFGCHIAKDRFFWMGGNSSSGGSVEWLREQLGGSAGGLAGGSAGDASAGDASAKLMSYEQLLALLDTVKPGPTGMLYYPYLTGSGAPQPDPRVKSSLIGLTKEHGQADIIKAVLEGTAYQLESIRKSAEGIAGRDIETLLVVGGGTRNMHWLQIKADVSNCALELPPIPEASLLGAAMAAGVGSGAYASVEEAVASIAREQSAWVRPNAEHHAEYRRLYEQGYVQLQTPLRAFFGGAVQT